MRVLLTGATGMLGQGVLRECLLARDVDFVQTIGRTAIDCTHPKLRNLIHTNLADCNDIEKQLRDFDACFFCLGVSSAGMSELEYSHVTYELTLAFAASLAKLNPHMVFVYVSGAGTDSTEKGSSMWARIKGKTENHLLNIGFKAVYLFRPGIIQPLNGATSKTRSYRLFYIIFAPLLPLLRKLFPRYILSTEVIAQAMLSVARKPFSPFIMEAQDIYRAATLEVERGR